MSKFQKVITKSIAVLLLVVFLGASLRVAQPTPKHIRIPLLQEKLK